MRLYKIIQIKKKCQGPGSGLFIFIPTASPHDTCFLPLQVYMPRSEYVVARILRIPFFDIRTFLPFCNVWPSLDHCILPLHENDQKSYKYLRSYFTRVEGRVSVRIQYDIYVTFKIVSSLPPADTPQRMLLFYYTAASGIYTPIVYVDKFQTLRVISNRDDLNEKRSRFIKIVFSNEFVMTIISIIL